MATMKNRVSVVCVRWKTCWANEWNDANVARMISLWSAKLSRQRLFAEHSFSLKLDKLFARFRETGLGRLAIPVNGLLDIDFDASSFLIALSHREGR